MEFTDEPIRKLSGYLLEILIEVSNLVLEFDDAL